jgi:hypothetical protein
VAFSSATARPGDLITVDVIIENDIPLGGLIVPFRWSTSDLQFIEMEFEEERSSGAMEIFNLPVNPVARTSGFIILQQFVPGAKGNIPVGRGPIAHLTFRIAEDAPDQIAFCDSLFEDGVGGSRRVEFTNIVGTLTIFPDVVPGLITIGHPEPAGLTVTPTEIFLQGNTDGDDALAGIQINSNGSTELDWSLAWQSLWLTASPSIGKTPAIPTIGAVLFDLDIGVYQDTLVINSANALNAPLKIPVTLVVDTALTIPDDLPFILMQNRPNPFVTYHDTHTEIAYVLGKPTHVTIEIYNVLGQRIRRLISRDDSAGEHLISWDGHGPNGRDVPSGNYFYRMTTSDGSVTKRMIVIK